MAFTPLSPKERAHKQERARIAPLRLSEAGIGFDRRNGGQHLIVEGFDCYIDFWPSTERWATRFGHKGRGLHNLIKLILGKE